ncbi:hypothetical protein DM02DRAFT_690743 [Periconia macrospinosa]|uniref:DUF7730 domain-containing protein n=1 Tax=Periconia macrospinosa TaxID=97972 RepID=A0A2V1EFH6_9PLEO|nr:hypothetical protein DM02DRAFT_690743 [Periconia macrospinosa]
MGPKRRKKCPISPRPPGDCITRRTRSQVEKQKKAKKEGESHLFLRLPLDIRMMIYKIIFAQVSAFRRNDILHFRREDRDAPPWERPAPVHAQTGQNVMPTDTESMAILRTCRQIYHEAVRVPFIYSKWCMDDWWFYRHLSFKGIEWITTLIMHNTGGPGADFFPEIINKSLKDFRSLNNIEVRAGGATWGNSSYPTFRMRGIRMMSVLVGLRPDASLSLCIRTETIETLISKEEAYRFFENPGDHLSAQDHRIWKQWLKIMDLMGAKSLTKVLKERQARQQNRP